MGKTCLWYKRHPPSWVNFSEPSYSQTSKCDYPSQATADSLSGHLRERLRMLLLESFRFEDEDESDHEHQIFSILSSARAWASVILAGKRDRRHHSTTGFSENVVVAETIYQI